VNRGRIVRMFGFFPPFSFSLLLLFSSLAEGRKEGIIALFRFCCTWTWGIGGWRVLARQTNRVPCKFCFSFSSNRANAD